MKIIKKLLITASLITTLAAGNTVQAQEVALKTDLLSDAFANPNLGVEFGLSPHWTAEFIGEYNNWKMWDDQLWKHWTLQGEARYWFCDRWLKHFVGLHAFGGEFNAGFLNHKLPFTTGDMRHLDEFRYQGWFVGGGLGYGYDWILGKHWNLEAEIGIGYIHSVYDKYNCENCMKSGDEDKHNNYVGPTKAAINLLYLF